MELLLLLLLLLPTALLLVLLLAFFLLLLLLSTADHPSLANVPKVPFLARRAANNRVFVLVVTVVGVVVGRGGVHA